MKGKGGRECPALESAFTSVKRLTQISVPVKRLTHFKGLW